MASEKVQARIEQAPAAQAAQASRPQSQQGAEPADKEASQEQPQSPAPQPGAWARFSAWFAKTFPHSRHAVIGGVCGLVVALLLFSIGLFKTAVIAVLVIIGVACGQYADGDPKLVNLVRELMKRR